MVRLVSSYGHEKSAEQEHVEEVGRLAAKRVLFEKATIAVRE